MAGVAQDADSGGLDQLTGRFHIRSRSASDPEQSVINILTKDRSSAKAEVGLARHGGGMDPSLAIAQ